MISNSDAQSSFHLWPASVHVRQTTRGTHAIRKLATSSAHRPLCTAMAAHHNHSACLLRIHVTCVLLTFLQFSLLAFECMLSPSIALVCV